MKFALIGHVETEKRLGVVAVDPENGHAGFVTGREDIAKVLRATLARKVLFDLERHGSGTVRVQVNRFDDRYLDILRHRLGPPLWSSVYGELPSHDVETALRTVWHKFWGDEEMPAPEVVDETGNIIQQEGLGIPSWLR